MPETFSELKSTSSSLIAVVVKGEAEGALDGGDRELGLAKKGAVLLEADGGRRVVNVCVAWLGKPSWRWCRELEKMSR